jgi:chromate transporter
VTDDEFEDAIAACNLLPGPASTQLAIFTAWQLGGPAGALVGGAAFILPGLVAILALAVAFLAASPPAWVLGAGAGAGAAVAAVAVGAGSDLVPPSWQRARSRWRWTVYAAFGGIAAATVGPWIVVVLLACGACEVAATWSAGSGLRLHAWPLFGVVVAAAQATGGLVALAWVALKVGALSYGGGFVIIPLMQADAVHHYHWMTGTQFLDAVALGQITPGPVTHTVAVVGYAADGILGGLVAALVAFAPSFAFVLVGARHFDRLRANEHARAFLQGAGPAAIGAIVGVAIPLANALEHDWQYVVLAAASMSIIVLKRSALATLLAAAAVGLVLGLVGVPVR